MRILIILFRNQNNGKQKILFVQQVIFDVISNTLLKTITRNREKLSCKYRVNNNSTHWYAICVSHKSTKSASFLLQYTTYGSWRYKRARASILQSCSPRAYSHMLLHSCDYFCTNINTQFKESVCDAYFPNDILKSWHCCRSGATHLQNSNDTRTRGDAKIFATSLAHSALQKNFVLKGVSPLYTGFYRPPILLSRRIFRGPRGARTINHAS